MIKAELLAKMSIEALQALQTAVQAEIDRRMDYSLKFGEPCYAIINGERKEFILRDWKRTRAHVEDPKTGTIYTIKKTALKGVGRLKENVPAYVPPASPAPKTSSSSVW